MSSKHTAAIFLTSDERAQELSDGLSAAGIESFVAHSSDDFYRLLNHQRIDLAVIEDQLQGFLSGLEILERLYNDLLRPATLLLAELSTDVRARAQALGIDLVASPSDSIEALVKSIQDMIVTTQHSGVRIPQQARKLVQQSDSIRPLPQLLAKMTGYLSHDTVSMDELAKDISVDPKITAELLKLTNSTALGLRRKVTKVFDAVNFLGVRRTVSLILSANVLRAQDKLLKPLPNSIRGWYNSRSVLIASTASSFAQNLEDVSAETAYILGLLQDIGILVLGHALGEPYLQMLKRVQDIAHLRLDVSERQAFHLTHAEVSAALLQKWGLPQSLIAMVLDHHGGEQTERSQTEQRFLHVMQIGEAVANLADRCTPQRHQIFNQLLARYGGAQAEKCKACMAEAVAKTAESSQLFAVPVPDEAVMDRLLHQISQPPPPIDPADFNSDVAEDGVPAADSAGSAPPDAATRSAASAINGSAADSASGRSNGVPAANRMGILVIEDEPAIVKMIRLFLAPLETEFYACDRLSEARRFAPHAGIILCDVHLGAENGVDIVRALRQDGYRGAVIMISRDRSRHTVEDCIEVGITDYLIKPFTRRALLEKLRKYAGHVSQPAAGERSGGQLVTSSTSEEII
jgi:HD-like signal output (HDOD) protein/CheY-like chemotaxis protein